jgi:hypothetical protein
VLLSTFVNQYFETTLFSDETANEFLEYLTLYIKKMPSNFILPLKYLIFEN